MNHLCFSIPSGSRSSLPHTVFNMKTVKEHLALDLEHGSVSIQLAEVSYLRKMPFKKKVWLEESFFSSLKQQLLTRNPQMLNCLFIFQIQWI